MSTGVSHSSGVIRAGSDTTPVAANGVSAFHAHGGKVSGNDGCGRYGGGRNYSGNHLAKAYERNGVLSIASRDDEAENAASSGADGTGSDSGS